MKATLTKSGIQLMSLENRRCWPLFAQLPSYIPFSEVLCVATSQYVPTWRRCSSLWKTAQVFVPLCQDCLLRTAEQFEWITCKTFKLLLYIWGTIAMIIAAPQVTHRLTICTFHRSRMRQCHWTPTSLDMESAVSTVNSSASTKRIIAMHGRCMLSFWPLPRLLKRKSGTSTNLITNALGRTRIWCKAGLRTSTRQ